MLNLKELEYRLDNALANETCESLSNWLFNQRKENLESFFGTGCIETLKNIPYNFNQKTSYKNRYKNNCKSEPGNNLLLAA